MVIFSIKEKGEKFYLDNSNIFSGNRGRVKISLNREFLFNIKKR